MRGLAAQTDTAPDAQGFPRPAQSLVSVIVCVWNKEEHVGEQLAALAEQTYRGRWELVVVDDGCKDGSMAVVESWRPRLPELRIVRTKRRRGLNHARNVGADAAAGELLAFCDADDVVVPGWLDALVAAAPHADLVGGVLDVRTLNDAVAFGWRPSDDMTRLSVAYGYAPYVAGGNCAIWADVARELRWNESYRFGCSDIEFGWRAYLEEYRLGFAPDAVSRQRYKTRMSSMLRQYARYGYGTPLLYRDFRDDGFESPGLAGARKIWKEILRTSPDLFRSRVRRGYWLRRLTMSLARLVGSIRWRAFYP